MRDFDGKEKYMLIDMIFKDNVKKSFSLDMLCEILRTDQVEKVRLILEQMERVEQKITSGPVTIDGEEVYVYISMEAYQMDGR